jgi:hypothetical protein
VAGPEQGARGNDAVAGLQLGEQGRVHRRHAGGGGAARLRPLDQRQPAFQHRHGGIAEAGVLVVVDRALEGGLGLLGIVVDETGGEIERLGGFAERTTLDAALHQQGSGTIGGGTGHRTWPSQQVGPTVKPRGVALQGNAMPLGLFSALVSPRRNPAGQITRAGRIRRYFYVPGGWWRQWPPLHRRGGVPINRAAPRV